MSAEAGLPDEVHNLPTWAPDQAELADLELLLSGAYAPLTGFLGSIDCAVVAAAGRLADGTPWPVEVTLTAPSELAKEERLVLQDPEGTPLAVLSVTESWEAPQGWRLAGPVTALRAPAHGPFRRMRRIPAEVRAELTAATQVEGGPSAHSPVLAVATREPLHRKQLGQLRQVSEQLAAGRLPGHAPGGETVRAGGEHGVRVLVLALLSGEHEDALVRSLLAVSQDLPEGTLIVPVSLARHDDPNRDLLLRAHIAAAYGATHLLGEEAGADRTDTGGESGPDSATVIPVVAPEPWAYDIDVEVWRPAARIDPDHQRAQLDAGLLAELLDRGQPIPEWFTPPAVAAELAVARPPRHRRGVTVFFTGLSGSGKSTVARGLADAVIERGGRSVSLLDGDVVRRLLSAGLTFSKADRDLNIRRIGYVAAEVTRHGGMAICAPIAPYASTRAQVRRMVSAVGDFVLIHVATPLAECERRDRKGLYAKARAGLIPEFTGISDPYEEPADADLVLDTSLLEPDEAVAQVLDLLVAGGWLRPA